MFRSYLGLNVLSIWLMVSIFCVVGSLPVNSEVDLVQEPKRELGQEHEEANETVGVNEKELGDESPIYEFQLAVWPEEYLGNVEPVTDNVYAPQYEVQEVVFPDLTDTQSDVSSVEVTIPTWQKPQIAEKPSTESDLIAAIYPDIHLDGVESVAGQDDDDDDVDHSLISGVHPHPVTQKPAPPKPHVEVIEQYQTVHPNGTTEYKLVLSNGMTNYKKIYNKRMPDGKVITVQEGYDSVPIPGDDPYSNEFQTQFYIADEHGHNVYRVEKHSRQPNLPQYLDYKLQLGQFN